MENIKILVYPNIKPEIIELTLEQLGYTEQAWNELSNDEKLNIATEYIVENTTLEALHYTSKLI